MTIPASAYGAPTVERTWVEIYCTETGHHGGPCRRLLKVTSSTSRFIDRIKCGRCGNITTVSYPVV